jgi:3alpha(or 20beta)-hydroxysteroid dehydrogenase
MGRLDGKVALITGGARGQGAAEGRLFAAEGAQVYLTDVRSEEGAKTAAEAGAVFVTHDVTSPDEWGAVVEQVVGECGRLDVLVNNAGILHWATMTGTRLEDWERIVAVNQTGVLLGMQAVAPQMMSQRSGSIINISSIGGMRGSGPCFAYGATKWAVRGMTKGAAQELGPDGRQTAGSDGRTRSPRSVRLGRGGRQPGAVAGVGREHLRQRRGVRARRRADCLGPPTISPHR